MIFDTGQPHGVIARHSGGFEVADFPAEQQDVTHMFLTWEFPIGGVHVGRALRIALDIDPLYAFASQSLPARDHALG